MDEEARIQMIRNAIPPDVLEAIVSREINERRDRRMAEQREAREQREPYPEQGRFAAVMSGVYRRSQKPVALADDRQYVAGALRHWRRVHGLSAPEAQARIGYSAKSSTWRHWESGFVVPPYRALLKIVAATGLGYWVDHDHRAGIDGDLRLEADAKRLDELARHADRAHR